jgi:hypothetical protein
MLTDFASESTRSAWQYVASAAAVAVPGLRQAPAAVSQRAGAAGSSRPTAAR